MKFLLIPALFAVACALSACSISGNTAAALDAAAVPACQIAAKGNVANTGMCIAASTAGVAVAGSLGTPAATN